MQARGRRHRTERIVRRRMDVVRLTPSSDLLRLRQPSGDAEIYTTVVHQVFLDRLPKRPLAVPLFSNSDGYRGLPSERAQTPRAFTPKRVLD